MKFTVPLQADNAGNPLGIFSVNTSNAAIVILFTNPGRWSQFSQVVASVLKREGVKLASFDVDAASFEAATAQLMAMDPSLRGAAKFIPDSAPVYAEVLRFFEEQLEA